MTHQAHRDEALSQLNPERPPLSLASTDQVDPPTPLCGILQAEP